LTPPSPGNSDWPDANPAPNQRAEKGNNENQHDNPSLRADSWRNRFTDAVNLFKAGLCMT
jgi:hypothetical protein